MFAFDKMAEDVRFVAQFLYGFCLGVMGEWFYLALLVLLILIVWVVIEWIVKHVRKLKRRR